MLNWFRKRQQTPSALKAVEIGDGNLTVDLPAHFAVEVQEGENRVTVAYDPAFDGATVRFSVLWISDRENPDADGLAIQAVHGAAEKLRKKVRVTGMKHYFTHAQATEEDGCPIDMHFWEAGLANAVVIASCCIVRSKSGHATSRFTLQCVEQAIRSLRRSAWQSGRVEGARKWDVREMSVEDAEQLRSWRDAAYGAARSVLGGPHFTGDNGDLRVIQAVLDSGGVGKQDTLALEGLGVVLGDMLARKLGLHWITVQDGPATTPALRYRDSGVVLFPRDMIVKRVEDGEAVQVVPLFNTLVEHVRNMIRSAGSGG